MVETVGVDLDTKDFDTLDRCMARCAMWGRIRYCRESGRGFHIRLVLDLPMHVLDSFTLRHWLGDDPHRILYDLRRYRIGHEVGIDVLFDAKVIFHRSLGTP